MDSSQQIRNVDFHSTRRAILFARHAVPAFVELHVRLALAHVDGKQIERAHIDADGAAFIGDTFALVDRDGRRASMKNVVWGKGHDEFSCHATASAACADSMRSLL